VFSDILEVVDTETCQILNETGLENLGFDYIDVFD
jgi:hypothetical protein